MTGRMGRSDQRLVPAWDLVYQAAALGLAVTGMVWLLQVALLHRLALLLRMVLL